MYRCFTNHNDDKVAYDKKNYNHKFELVFQSRSVYYFIYSFFLSSNFCILLLLYFEVEFFLCRNFHANIWRFFCCTIYLFIFGRYLFKSQCGIRIYFFCYLPIYRVRKRTNKIVNSKMRQMKLFEFLQFLLPIRMNILPLLN